MTTLKTMLGRTLFVLSASSLALAMPAAAQNVVPDDLTTIAPVPTDYEPPKTSWGAPDLRGTYPIDNIASLPMNRPAQYGDRFYLTEEEFAARQEQAGRSDAAYAAEEEAGTIGMGHWVESDASGRRTSLLVHPANGQLPSLTEDAQKRYEAGRSSWTPNTNFEWLGDFDTWDRCITRGFPASMFPFRYNNGIRVLQAPGFVTIQLEMIHDARVIPIVADKAAADAMRWPDDVRAWMGQSIGWWEGNTLVVETTNIVAGDSVPHDTYSRGPSPLNMATMGVPPFNTIPTGVNAKVTERLTMTEPGHIVYELTYNDPEVFTDKWTARLDWTQDNDYTFFEYACHEGNVQPRNYITASRAGLEALSEEDAASNTSH
ncbi:hypothetical protein [Aurantiacibacter flavus]|uniref:Uncharacterized protein n=1 Tax=Aurantiacibacter flavus TaxID=3145232 RepID=A0ABV0CW02_9SPHN